MRPRWLAISTVLLGVARGMLYAHDKGTCHGGLNPSTILFKVCALLCAICQCSKLLFCLLCLCSAAGRPGGCVRAAAKARQFRTARPTSDNIFFAKHRCGACSLTPPTPRQSSARSAPAASYQKSTTSASACDAALARVNWVTCGRARRSIVHRKCGKHTACPL